MSLLLIYALLELKYAVHLKSYYKIYYALSPYIISPHIILSYIISPLCFLTSL